MIVIALGHASEHEVEASANECGGQEVYKPFGQIRPFLAYVTLGWLNTIVPSPIEGHC
jgi:hypothetical protein